MSANKKFALILAVIAALLIVSAVCLLRVAVIAPVAEENEDLKIEKLETNSEYLKNGYLERYGVPTETFTYQNNGGAEAGVPLSNAFDRNFGSVWRSSLQYRVADKQNTTNYVEAKFNSPTLIDRIIYQADSSWYDRGYPNKIRISYVLNGADGYTVLNELESRPSDKIILITLTQAQTVNKIKIEWTDVNPNHRTCAAASEIIFLQPHSDNVEAVQNMFTDYAQLNLRSDITSAEDVERLREKVKDYKTYPTELSALLNRAEQVLAKTVVYDSRREMCTDGSSENTLLRLGDVAGYARGPLKMPWFGTNRQVTGISASPDDVLTIYVTGNDNDPLPSLVITQFWGSWSSWKSGEYKLRLGKNVIHPANYVQAGFTTNTGDPIPAGGPIYLTNPYTPQNQSSNVKVYIEGGTLIPVFRKGGDEGQYYNRLKEYASYVEADKTASRSAGKVEKAVDVTEIVSRNIILTVRASLADRVYNGEGVSVEKACRGWDDYIIELLESDGVVVDKNNNKYNGQYDERAQYLNCNIRLMQPFGAAYAFTEHVGIQVPWERGALLGSGFGWGYTHELGHMMDIGERLVSECSNNMLSKYNETAMEKVATRGDFEKTTAALSPDVRSESSYWNTNRGNFIIWWLIESFEIGYWPRLENLYRYEKVSTDYGKMNATEKQVYLSSISVGYDLSYYFERWGYNLSGSDVIFKEDSASPAFKALMNEAKSAGRIKNEGYQPKIWYLDAAEYLIRKEGAEKTQLYTSGDVPELQSVTKGAEGYTLFMRSDKCLQPAHLGFEIWEGTGANKRVIGFTYGQSFTDTTKYNSGYTPVYTVVAYDRALRSSAESAPQRINVSDAVCRISQTTYGSLYEALLAAKNGETIVMLKDCPSPSLVIDKDVTIVADGADRTIYKTGASALFHIAQNGKLTLKGTNSAKLILDGNSFPQLSPLVRAEGSFSADGCVFQNNIVKQQKDGLGGAIYAVGSSNAIITVENCEFKNNSAWQGGAIYVRSGVRNVYTNCKFTQNSAVDGGAVYCGNSVATFEDCIFIGNVASGNGGAFAAGGGSVVKLNGCNISANEAVKGGGIYSDSAVTVTGGSLSANTASAEGGAIYFLTTVNGRRFTVSGATVSQNNCGGAAVYLSGLSGLTQTTVLAGDCLYALHAAGGSVNLSGGSVSGAIFISENSSVSATGELISPESGKIKLCTDKQINDSDGENPVIEVITADFAIDAAAANGFESDCGEVVVGENGKSLCLALQTISVGFTVGGKTTQKRYLPGQRFTLDNISGEKDTYVTAWVKDGVTYKIGDEITVNEPMTFTAVTAKKVAVTYRFAVDDAPDDIVFYYIPGETYTIISYDIEKYVLNGWDIDGKTMMPYVTAKADKDTTYTANLTAKLKVEYYIDRADGKGSLLITTRYYAFGEKLQVVDLGAYKGEDINEEDYVPAGRYIENYKLRETGELIDAYNYTVVSDLVLEAYVTDMPAYIIYGILYKDIEGGDPTEFITDEVKMGSTYTVSLDLVPYGYHISSLKYNGVDYPEDKLDGFVIENVSEPTYGIEIVLERNLYNVVYQYNGDSFKEEQLKFQTSFTLEEPENLPEKYHFMSYKIGKSELVMLEDGSFEMQNVEIDMGLGSEITVTENTVINIQVYIEGEEELPGGEEELPGGDAPENPDEGHGGVNSGCAGCGSTDMGGGLTLGGGVAAMLLIMISLSHVLRRKTR